MARWETISSFVGEEPKQDPPTGWVPVSGEDGAWYPFALMATDSISMVVWRRKLRRAPKPSHSASDLPGWVMGPAAAGNVPAAQLVASVVQCLGLITGRNHKPHRCGTDARLVLSLWKARGYPALELFAAEVELVARAARESANPLFARDVRGEGWDGAPDRSRSVDTLLRHKKWSERIDAARRWENRPRGNRSVDVDDLYRREP